MFLELLLSLQLTAAPIGDCIMKPNGRAELCKYDNGEWRKRPLRPLNKADLKLIEAYEAAHIEQPLPHHGETTPITKKTDVVVQSAYHNFYGYSPYTPWLNQLKNTGLFQHRYLGQRQRNAVDIEYDEFGIPVFPDEEMQGVYIAYLWFGTHNAGESHDVAGEWVVSHSANTDIGVGGANVELLSDTSTQKRFRCEKYKSCLLEFSILDGAPDKDELSLIRVRDGDGNALSNEQDYINGLITREEWRRAMYGYSEFRPMQASSVATASNSIVRYDEIAPIDHFGWVEYGSKIEIRGSEGKWTPDPERGLKKSMVPVLARLRTAYELGAVYHHNFPPYLYEHTDGVTPDPEVVGEWAVNLWEDDTIPLSSKLDLFNDTEFQHVDSFGEEMMANRQYIVDNKVIVEIANETWNNGYPYNIGAGYMARKSVQVASQMGRAHFGGNNSIAFTGYLATKTIARLRKKFPAIEWRGILATQTAFTTNYCPSTPNNRSTESGQYNFRLCSLLEGYYAFWADYESNIDQWSEWYAPEPENPGDWFEVQGTTYYYLDAQRSDMKSHLAGVSPSEMVSLTSNEANWPALRAHILRFFVEGIALEGSINGQYGLQGPISSLSGLKQIFSALSDHAEVYGMQVSAYEGGSHADLGSYYRGTLGSHPEVHAFWTDFNDSVEMALIQAAVHDAAVDVGWVGISDFHSFQGSNDGNVFGERKSFEDVTPRYCEYVRWMSAAPNVPVGLGEANDLVRPQEKCGGLIDYLNQAKVNNYYVGQPIPAAAEILPK